MKVDPPWEIFENRIKALSIATSVFSQINLIQATSHGGASYEVPAPRTLKDFRESVDAVFKAAGLEKVEWE